MLCFGVLVLDLLHEVVSRDMTDGSRRVRHLRPAVALVCYQGDCFALGQTDLPRFCGLKIETHDEQASLRVKYFVVAVVVTTPLWSHRLLLSWSHEEVQRRHPPPGPVCRHHLRPAVAVVDKHAHGFTLNQADLPVFACFELKRGDQRNAFAFPLLRVIILAILLVIVFVALVDGLHSHFHRVVVIVLLLTTTSAAAAVATAAVAAAASSPRPPSRLRVVKVFNPAVQDDRHAPRQQRSVQVGARQSVPRGFEAKRARHQVLPHGRV
mmetsp:Transcript_36055/g.71464  ORF Transcript_36055/g.71464 Transcript_36055/m.71464 type:complete len:267 (-) Transcript_36055:751-1551(-)